MIKGKSVGLRAIEREDLALMRDWRNIEGFRRNFREFRELNLANQEHWFERIVLNSANDLMFMIARLEDGKPLGVCGLVYINWVIRSADLSFYIGHEEQYIDGYGYAAEAAALLIRYAFDTCNLHKVWTELYEFDDRKIDFYTKIGLKRDAVLRDNCFEGGRYWNSYIYSLLQTDEKPSK